MMKLIFALIILLLFVWRIKRGFANGIMGEIVTIVSGAVALICVVLIFFAVTSVRAKAMSTLTVCIAALILLGILFRGCSLIFSPLLALSNISIIEGVNKILGAFMGAVEACVISGLLYYGLEYAGVFTLLMPGL